MKLETLNENSPLEWEELVLPGIKSPEFITYDVPFDDEGGSLSLEVDGMSNYIARLELHLENVRCVMKNKKRFSVSEVLSSDEAQVASQKCVELIQNTLEALEDEVESHDWSP
jgi:hypothetical protein